MYEMHKNEKYKLADTYFTYFALLLYFSEIVREVHSIPVNFPSGNQKFYPDLFNPNQFLRGGGQGPRHHLLHQTRPDIEHGKSSDAEESGGRYANKRHASSSKDFKMTMGSNFNHQNSERFEETHHAQQHLHQRNSDKMFRHWQTPPDSNYGPGDHSQNSPNRDRRFSPEMNSNPRQNPNYLNREEDFFQKNHEGPNHNHKYRDSSFIFKDQESFRNPQGYHHYEDTKSPPQHRFPEVLRSDRQPKRQPQNPPLFNKTPYHHHHHHPYHLTQIPPVQPPPKLILVQGTDGNGNSTMFIEYDVSDKDVTYETTVEVEEPSVDQQLNHQQENQENEVLN